LQLEGFPPRATVLLLATTGREWGTEKAVSAGFAARRVSDTVGAAEELYALRFVGTGVT
jgi:hypothetical protein